MINALEGSTSTLVDIEKWIRDLEDRLVEINQNSMEKKNKNKTGQFKGPLE